MQPLTSLIGNYTLIPSGHLRAPGRARNFCEPRAPKTADEGHARTSRTVHFRYLLATKPSETQRNPAKPTKSSRHWLNSRKQTNWNPKKEKNKPKTKNEKRQDTVTINLFLLQCNRWPKAPKLPRFYRFVSAASEHIHSIQRKRLNCAIVFFDRHNKAAGVVNIEKFNFTLPASNKSNRVIQNKTSDLRFCGLCPERLWSSEIPAANLRIFTTRNWIAKQTKKKKKKTVIVLGPILCWKNKEKRTNPSRSFVVTRNCCSMTLQIHHRSCACTKKKKKKTKKNKKKKKTNLRLRSKFLCKEKETRIQLTFWAQVPNANEFVARARNCCVSICGNKRRHASIRKFPCRLSQVQIPTNYLLVPPKYRRKMNLSVVFFFFFFCAPGTDGCCGGGVVNRWNFLGVSSESENIFESVCCGIASPDSNRFVIWSTQHRARQIRCQKNKLKNKLSAYFF